MNSSDLPQRLRWGARGDYALMSHFAPSHHTSSLWGCGAGSLIPTLSKGDLAGVTVQPRSPLTAKPPFCCKLGCKREGGGKKAGVGFPAFSDLGRGPRWYPRSLPMGFRQGFLLRELLLIAALLCCIADQDQMSRGRFL